MYVNCCENTGNVSKITHTGNLSTGNCRNNTGNECKFSEQLRKWN